MVPIVSVCIPSYNHAPFIGECIESVLSQSCQDFEILISDDASTDNSLEVIERFKDSRITVERHGRTLGPSAAINSSVQRARGQYVAILGSDDLFMPGKLEQQVSFLDQEREICAAFSLVHGVNELGDKVPDDTFPLPAVFRQTNRTKGEWLRRFFLDGNCLCASTAVIRKTVMSRVGAHDLRLLQLQDLDYWIRICLVGEIHVIQRPLVAYRIRMDGQNLSGDRPDANARVQWEAQKVLRHFSEIHDRRLLFDVFPSLQTEAVQALPLPYLLATEALKSAQPSVRLFGLDLLFDVFGNETQKATLEQHGIFPSTLFDLFARVDPMNLQRIAQLESEMAVLERALRKGRNAVERTSRGLIRMVGAARRWYRRRYPPKP